MKNNLLNALLAAGITLGWWLIIYFMFAFVQWDFNPAKWSQDSRFFYSFVGGFFGLAGGIMILLVFLLKVKNLKNNRSPSSPKSKDVGRWLSL